MNFSAADDGDVLIISLITTMAALLIYSSFMYSLVNQFTNMFSKDIMSSEDGKPTYGGMIVHTFVLYGISVGLLYGYRALV